MFKLPFSIFPVKVLRKWSHLFLGLGDYLTMFFPFIEIGLKQAKIEEKPREYITICFLSSLITFIFIAVFSNLLLYLADVEKFLLFSITVSLIFSFFGFMQQIMYPRLLARKRVKSIERNLLPALQNILIQFNSGVAFFDILVNISKENYGEISAEFTRAVKEINAGKSQIEVLEEVAAVNPSLFFRRALWQLVNGLKAGSEMSSVLTEIISSLSEQQVLQIQKYGSQLNPLAMFYMLVVVIIPALGITFLIIISSFIALSESATKFAFWGLYGFVVFFQIMFLGMIKSKRPNLLS
ncbi:hypothetical protein CMO89_03995 [Candidatus Woesearchaeota archaeon]|nr:hypothetical protein [Candidatus Woesearchaeota archaeon]|tara:strand:+ start:2531 stop:3418 length:888 start_codon:yes stop_codon:yes gene_type:complete